MLLAAMLMPALAAAAAEHDPWAAIQTIERVVPKSLQDHPGNVFLGGEPVVIPAPESGEWTRFSVKDDAGNTVSESARPEGAQVLPLGTLPVGWYRVDFVKGDGAVETWTTAAVLAPLKAPTPQDSPVCIDTAMAWFAKNNEVKQRKFASLAALAGVNWSRDRMSWGEVETAPDAYAEPETTYDTSASAGAAEKLKVLQVFHSTPAWALRPELDGEGARNRFPRDLRDLYGFCKTMAERYEGTVQAWEPWNEANIEPFGGHLINEMCSLQKAAYFAFKAGDPDLTVCWNVYAGSGSRHHSEGVLLNEVWPYFETYNIHTYSSPKSYLSQFEGPREAACGRPIWLTECGIRLLTQDAAPWGDLSPEDEIRQAEFIAQSYANSIYAGVNRHFFFILGNYIERGVQFGLLRHDLTPRPGYVALAAVGRMLAGARPAGRLDVNQAAGAQAYVFRAEPGGTSAELIVAWSDTEYEWSPALSAEPAAAYDYLGRTRPVSKTFSLSPKALFIVVPEGAAQGLSLEVPPEVAAYREDAPCPVVLQVELPFETARLGPQAYELPAGTPSDVPLWVYNFSDAPVSGRLRVASLPEGWTAAFADDNVQIQPMDRAHVVLRTEMAAHGRAVLFGDWVRIEGDFGEAGKPVVAFRLVGARESLTPEKVTAIEGASDPARWVDNVVQGATMTHRATEDGGMAFSIAFGESDPWAYPRFQLEAGERPAAEDDGIAVTAHLAEGAGVIRVQFIEDTGAAYAADLTPPPGAEGPQRMVALFEDAQWGSYSREDPDGKLQPEQITAILVGINSERGSRAELVVANPAWVRY